MLVFEQFAKFGKASKFSDEINKAKTPSSQSH